MQANRTLMRWIVNSSLRFRFLVVAAAVAMMAVGTLLVPNMRVDAFPEFAPPLVEIKPRAWACPRRTWSHWSPSR